VLWWWFFLLTLIGLTVLLYRGVQCRYTHLSFSLTLAPFPDFQVFLVLWWWFTLLFLIGLVRLVYRFIQCRYPTAPAPTACRGKVVRYSRIKGTISFIFSHFIYVVKMVSVLRNYLFNVLCGQSVM
jgi:hypothetical protein